jgi:hypothetical protein
MEEERTMPELPYNVNNFDENRFKEILYLDLIESITNLLLYYAGGNIKDIPIEKRKEIIDIVINSWKKKIKNSIAITHKKAAVQIQKQANSGDTLDVIEILIDSTNQDAYIVGRNICEFVRLRLYSKFLHDDNVGR